MSLVCSLITIRVLPKDISCSVYSFVIFSIPVAYILKSISTYRESSVKVELKSADCDC